MKNKMETDAFLTKWGLQGIELDKEGSKKRINMIDIRTILAFEGFENVKVDMWEGLKIYKFLTHEMFEAEISFVNGNFCVKKIFKELKNEPIHQTIESSLLKYLMNANDGQLEEMANEYQKKYKFRTEESKSQLMKLASYFICSSIHWTKKIEEELNKDFVDYGLKTV